MKVLCLFVAVCPAGGTDGELTPSPRTSVLSSCRWTTPDHTPGRHCACGAVASVLLASKVCETLINQKDWGMLMVLVFCAVKMQQHNNVQTAGKERRIRPEKRHRNHLRKLVRLVFNILSLCLH